MIRLELQSSGHFSILNVSAVSLLLTKLDISLTDLHTSQERFSTPSPPPPPLPPPQTHRLDLPFASILDQSWVTQPEQSEF